MSNTDKNKTKEINKQKLKDQNFSESTDIKILTASAIALVILISFIESMVSF